MQQVSKRKFAFGATATAGLGLFGWPSVAFAQAAANLPSYRWPNDPDDNDALRRALQASLTVYLPAGGGSGPNGDYQIGTHPVDPNAPSGQRAGNIPSGATIYGDGSFRTIVRQLSEVIFLLNSDSSDTANNISNITIRNMTLYGRTETAGYSEHTHDIRLSGVTNVLIEGVEFRAFQGDGLYLGSITREGRPRHNVNVTVRSCRFDGINRQNRNGISVIDCTGFLIDGCRFENLTTDNNPGAIDIEPEAPEDLVAHGHITNCSFYNCGGAAFSLLASQPRTDFLFDHCNIQQCRGAFEHVGARSTNPTDAMQPFNVRIQALYVDGVKRPFYIRGTYGLEISGNTFRNADVSYLAASEATEGPLISENVTITNNAFVNCGNVTGAVIIQDGSVKNLQVTNNQIIDCGATGQFNKFYYLRAVTNNTGQPYGDVRTLRLNDNVIRSDSMPNKMNAYGYIVGGYAQMMRTYTDVQNRNTAPTQFTLSGPDNLYEAP